jgi:phospholipase C
MLENRSFDHILGSLAQTKKIEGIQTSSPNANNYLGRAYPQTPDAPRNSPRDPNHDLTDVLTQLDINPAGVPQMDGFVKSYAQANPLISPDQFGEVMQYYPEGGLPILHQLATQFTVCDHWFSSLPGPTWPNRLFAMTGTSLGKVTMPGGLLDLNLHWYDQPTVFDRLNEKQISWKVYFGDIAVSMVLVHQWEPENAILHRPLVEFYSDLNDPANFPRFVWIEPSYLPPGTNDYHPPHDVFDGEELLANVYNALRSNEEIWKSTLLVVLFDEHGGFYDHVSPPSAVPPDHHQEQWTFDRLGVRVPAILVSPWVGNGVLSDVFDHTSILRFVSDLWGLGPLGQRTAQAKSFASAISTSLRTDAPTNLVVPAVGTLQSAISQTLTDHELAMFSLSQALESMAEEDANVVAARARQILSGPASQIDAAVDRVDGFLRHQASIVGKPQTTN